MCRVEPLGKRHLHGIFFQLCDLVAWCYHIRWGQEVVQTEQHDNLILDLGHLCDEWCKPCDSVTMLRHHFDLCRRDHFYTSDSMHDDGEKCFLVGHHNDAIIETIRLCPLPQAQGQIHHRHNA